MKTLFKATIRFYRYFISPAFFPACRFHPTCSAYALEAMDEHGALRGAFISIWRVLRCNPFSRGGFDPVAGAGRETKIQIKKEAL